MTEVCYLLNVANPLLTEPTQHPHELDQVPGTGNWLDELAALHCCVYTGHYGAEPEEQGGLVTVLVTVLVTLNTVLVTVLVTIYIVTNYIVIGYHIDIGYYTYIMLTSSQISIGWQRTIISFISSYFH